MHLARLPNIKTLKQLIENMTGNNTNLHDHIFSLLPSFLRSLKEFHNTELQIPDQLIFLCDNKAITAKDIKTSQLQTILKTAGNKISTQNIAMKYNSNQEIDNESTFSQLYNKIKDPKLRAIRYKILQGDVFCKERMHRFGMSENNLCERCGDIETKSHQLHDCQFAKSMWEHYNKIIRYLKIENASVLSIEQAILPEKHGNIVSETLKSIILKANIQIERPKHNVEKIINSLFLSQAKIEALTYIRMKSRCSKILSTWTKLQLLLRNT
jgi:hypothetical protein